jgi:hypothetical protein
MRFIEGMLRAVVCNSQVTQGCRFDSCQGPKVAFFTAVPLNNFYLQHPSNVNSNAF